MTISGLLGEDRNRSSFRNVVFFCFLEYRTMDKVQKPSSPEYHIPSSEHLKSTHDYFLSNPFNFIIYQSSYHLILFILDAERVVETFTKSLWRKQRCVMKINTVCTFRRISLGLLNGTCCISEKKLKFWLGI
jgi:hypothetical protein